MKSLHLKYFLLFPSLALCFTAAARAQDTWPDGPVTFIASTPPGGSVDQWSRALAPYLADELGVPVVVENVGGAGGILAHVRLLRDGGDGDVILSSLIPVLAEHIEAGRVPYSLDDFNYLNVPSDEYALLIATGPSPFNTAEELIEGLRNEPDTYSEGLAPGTGSSILVEIFRERLAIPTENYRQVVYDGGGPMIAALLGGHVDFAGLPERNFDRVEGARVLAVFRDERPERFQDVPTVNEVLARHGASMPSMNTGIRAVMVPASLKEEYPDRWQTLYDALERVYQREDALAEFEELNTGTNWLGAEKSREVVNQFIENFADYLGR